MSASPRERALLPDYEFQALAVAENYRTALLSEFRPFLQGRILEVGAGLGQLTRLLVREAGIQRLVAVEPDARFVARLRQCLPQPDVIQGTIEDVPADWSFDAIVSVNVLEHIAMDEKELAAYRARLDESHGMLCLFVPARPEIFGAIDRAFGHQRRYHRGELRAKLETAGFRVERLFYFNLVGYFAWWWNFRLRRRRRFHAGSVRVFDRFIFPLQHRIESRLLRPPIGQSLIAIAEAG